MAQMPVGGGKDPAAGRVVKIDPKFLGKTNSTRPIILPGPGSWRTPMSLFPDSTACQSTEAAFSTCALSSSLLQILRPLRQNAWRDVLLHEVGRHIPIGFHVRPLDERGHRRGLVALYLHSHHDLHPAGDRVSGDLPKLGAVRVYEQRLGAVPSSGTAPGPGRGPPAAAGNSRIAARASRRRRRRSARVAPEASFRAMSWRLP